MIVIVDNDRVWEDRDTVFIKTKSLQQVEAAIKRATELGRSSLAAEYRIYGAASDSTWRAPDQLISFEDFCRQNLGLQPGETEGY